MIRKKALHLYKPFERCSTLTQNKIVFQLLKLERKISGLLLLGGVVEGRLMSVQDMKSYANLPSLQTLQAQLVSTLSTPAQHLSQNLSANQVCFALLNRQPAKICIHSLLHTKNMYIRILFIVWDLFFCCILGNKFYSYCSNDFCSTDRKVIFTSVLYSNYFVALCSEDCSA